jgi:catechol 2,3-dioxygenase
MPVLISFRTSTPRQVACPDRIWDDSENSSIRRTAAMQPRIGQTHFRESAPEALQRRVGAIGATGPGCGWEDGDPGAAR